jgi:hypothetical protein
MGEPSPRVLPLAEHYRHVWRSPQAGRARPPLDHAVGVLLPHGLVGERACLAGRRLEQGRVRFSRDAGGGDVFIEVLLQTVVTRDLVLLASFFAQPDPAAWRPCTKYSMADN